MRKQGHGQRVRQGESVLSKYYLQPHKVSLYFTYSQTKWVCTSFSYIQLGI